MWAGTVIYFKFIYPTLFHGIFTTVVIKHYSTSSTSICIQLRRSDFFKKIGFALFFSNIYILSIQHIISTIIMLHTPTTLFFIMIVTTKNFTFQWNIVVQCKNPLFQKDVASKIFSPTSYSASRSTTIKIVY